MMRRRQCFLSHSSHSSLFNLFILLFFVLFVSFVAFFFAGFSRSILSRASRYYHPNESLLVRTGRSRLVLDNPRPNGSATSTGKATMKLRAQVMQTLLEPPAAPAAAAMHHGCPLCGRIGHELLHTLDSGEVRRCGECGFVFARGSHAADSEEGYYDSMGGYEQFVDAKKDEWRELFRDLAARTDGRRLLEIGCARGYALALAREAGWLPFGVETSAGDAAFARGRFGLHVHHGIVETCPFPSGAFDAITMWSVIEHIPDPLAALRACRRLIRPGGVLSIHTPNADSSVAATLGANWKMLHLPGHVSFFGPGTMRMALRKCGFELIRLDTGLGSRPVNVDPHARRKFSFRKAASSIVTHLGLKEPLREMIYAVQPQLREQGEFMAVLAKPAEE